MLVLLLLLLLWWKKNFMRLHPHEREIVSFVGVHRRQRDEI